jgi:hypothetical protein
MMRVLVWPTGARLRARGLRQRLRTAVVGLPVALVLAAVPADGAGAQPGPPSGTGPRVERRSPRTIPRLVDLRVGRHTGFDRVTFVFDGGLPGYRIQYVAQLREFGTGKLVELDGDATLSVLFDPATVRGDGGVVYEGPKVVTPRYPSLRQVKNLLSFEGQTLVGLGLEHRVGFRVLELEDPYRVAVDVAHGSTGVAPLLRRGDRGPAVAVWQRELNRWLDDDLAVDGIYGPVTEGATIRFQRAAGIAVDGIVGPQTRAAMRKVLDERPT